SGRAPNWPPCRWSCSVSSAPSRGAGTARTPPGSRPCALRRCPPSDRRFARSAGRSRWSALVAHPFPGRFGLPTTAWLHDFGDVIPTPLIPPPATPNPDPPPNLPALQELLEERRQFRLTQLSELAADSDAVHRHVGDRGDVAADTARGEVVAALVAAA